MKHEFSHKYRVYWEDTDAGGIMYHGQYVNFAERARSEWLRKLAKGKTQKQIADEMGFTFVVSHMDVSFKYPAFLDDELTVTANVIGASGCHITFEQHVLRDTAILAILIIKIVSINNEGRPVRLPKQFISEYNHG